MSGSLLLALSDIRSSDSSPSSDSLTFFFLWIGRDTISSADLNSSKSHLKVVFRMISPRHKMYRVTKQQGFILNATFTSMSTGGFVQAAWSHCKSRSRLPQTESFCRLLKMSGWRGVQYEVLIPLVALPPSEPDQCCAEQVQVFGDQVLVARTEAEAV